MTLVLNSERFLSQKKGYNEPILRALRLKGVSGWKKISWVWFFFSFHFLKTYSFIHIFCLFKKVLDPMKFFSMKHIWRPLWIAIRTVKDRNSFHSRAMAFSKISSTLKLLIFVSISGNHQLLGLEVSIYCRENMRGGGGWGGPSPRNEVESNR